MSEHDDTLLDEDLGDEEYDLGNDEEEALLADDYEIERQNSYKGEEETDDILDLGVTDALDDLEGEDENIEFSKSKTDIHNTNDFYKDGDQQEAESTYYKQDENVEYKTEQIHQYEANSACDNINVSNTIGKGDLREKLQKNMQKIYIGNGQGLEDDDCEEAKERRNRFQNERTIVSPKMNNDIPDTLENVVTSELSKSSFRGRGRGRCSRGSKGGRFNPQNSGNYSPRFSGTRTSTFDNQQPSCRPLLLETRLPFLLGVPNYLQNQQIMCQQSNLQVQTFQLFSPNSSLQGSSHFVDNRPQFNPNQFQGPVGPGAVGSRLEYGPRGPIATPLQGPAYNCPPNQPPYLQIQQMPFQGPGTHIQDNHSRHMPPNQGPLLHTNSSGSLLGNPSPMTAGNITPMLTNNQSLPPLQGNSVLPMQPFPRQQTPTQGPPIQNHPNSQIPSQSTFENRAPFQEQHFENRSVYESRPAYPDQVSNNSQFNNNTLSVTQQPCSNIPNVPLPPGHKILINPHFRGTVQATNDARVWDSVQHQIPVQPQISNNQFNQAPMPYQNQNPYNQPQQNSLQYQQNCQQNKSDDPYAYFSDVWQENKPQKSQSINSSKQYSLDNNYSRESGYSDCGNKYKSDAQWEQRSSYQEEYKGVQQNYRERDLSSRPRNEHVQKSRPPSNVYRADTYDQNHVQKNNSRSITTPIRGINRLQQKRVLDKGLHDTSPKKVKPNNRNLQEVQTVATLNDIIEEKKDEDNDPEMQEYRKKMEEQKRLREKILREKENRRKMAAMEKQNEEVKGESNAAIKFTESVQQEGKPVSVLMGVVKDVLTNKNRPGIGRGPNRPVNIQTAEVTERAPGTRIVRTIQTVQPTDSLDSDQNEKCNSGFVTGPISEKAPVRQLNPQYNTRRVVIQKPLTNSQKVATTIQKTVSNLQKGPISAQNVHLRATQPPLLKKLSNVGQKVISNTQRIATPKVVINTQNNQRVVLQKVLLQSKKAPEVKTNTVKLENMAASTSEAQIRRMCQGIGTIESIHMGEGNATIVFKTQSAAMVFHKKYQRKMLDLSLITVRLVPQTSMNKATTSVAKKS